MLDSLSQASYRRHPCGRGPQSIPVVFAEFVSSNNLENGLLSNKNINSVYNVLNTCTESLILFPNSAIVLFERLYPVTAVTHSNKNRPLITNVFNNNPTYCISWSFLAVAMMHFNAEAQTDTLSLYISSSYINLTDIPAHTHTHIAKCATAVYTPGEGG